jgi:hypothetical protein
MRASILRRPVTVAPIRLQLHQAHASRTFDRKILVAVDPDCKVPAPARVKFSDHMVLKKGVLRGVSSSIPPPNWGSVRRRVARAVADCGRRFVFGRAWERILEVSSKNFPSFRVGLKAAGVSFSTRSDRALDVLTIPSAPSEETCSSRRIEQEIRQRSRRKAAVGRAQR